MGVNRVSSYLNPHKLVPSRSSSFDDYMVRALADVLIRMMASGQGTKDELIREYSDGRFAIDSPLYCESLQVDELTVTPRQVFKCDTSIISRFSFFIVDVINEYVEDDEAAESLREQWALILRSLLVAPYFVVWRMAFMTDNRDDEDRVGVFGAFCNQNEAKNHWDAESSGLVLACHFKAMLRAQVLQPVGWFA